MRRKRIFILFAAGFFILHEISGTHAQTGGKASPKQQPLLPDFVIVKAVVTDANQGAIKATVKNRGAGDGKNCEIRLRVWSKDGSQMIKTFEQNQLSIKAGDELIISFLAEMSLWNRKFTLETDAAKTVKESSENNNQFSGQVSN